MKTKRGQNRKPGAPALPGAGRPRLALDARQPRKDGRLAFWIDLEHAAKLQRLMLRDVPGVSTPEQMIEYLIDSAA